MSSPKNIILLDKFDTKTPANSPNDDFSNMKKMTITKKQGPIPELPPSTSPTVSPTSKFSPTNRSPSGFSPVQNILGRITSFKESLSPSKGKDISPRKVDDDDVFDLSDDEDTSSKIFKIFNSNKS